MAPATDEPTTVDVWLDSLAPAATPARDGRDSVLLDGCAAGAHHLVMDTFHGFVGVQGRGTVALPAVLRRRYHLDEPGAQVEIAEREDGVIEVRPAVAVPATQAWFWTPEWQQREREVDEHVAAGRASRFDDEDGFGAHLDNLEADAQTQ